MVTVFDVQLGLAEVEANELRLIYIQEYWNIAENSVKIVYLYNTVCQVW